MLAEAFKHITPLQWSISVKPTKSIFCDIIKALNFLTDFFNSFSESGIQTQRNFYRCTFYVQIALYVILGQLWGRPQKLSYLAVGRSICCRREIPSQCVPQYVVFGGGL